MDVRSISFTFTLFLLLPFFRTYEINDNLYNDCFFDAVNYFKQYDQLLSSRLTEKEEMKKTSTNINEYIEILRNSTSNGTFPTSQSTRNWLSELLQGVTNDYIQLNNPSQYEKVESVETFFKQNDNSHNYFLMEITGQLKHFWTVEQLPQKRGYRIYQSYEGAYTLNAWLNEYSNNIDSHWWNGDIIYWQTNYDRLKVLLKLVNIDIENLDSLSERKMWWKPWLKSVKDYPKEDIIDNFKKSWNLYGGGIIISHDLFNNTYFPKLMNLTEEINSMIGSSQEWTLDLHNDWIELFGSPNPFVYPGLPFITQTQTGSFKKEPTTLKAYIIKNPSEMQIKINAELLKDSLKIEDAKQFCSTATKIKLCFTFILLSALSTLLT